MAHRILFLAKIRILYAVSEQMAGIKAIMRKSQLSLMETLKSRKFQVQSRARFDWTLVDTKDPLNPPRLW